ncbi:DsbA family protein [Nostoc sphaeroides]|uniref:Disulfide bond formation protein DsbA n=1 Tax=Nostoc sphaeroides CCNUC1 TaxID=2653204 RepID=A0A5P8WAT1_9NOSO|nr:thioredoxin domain-containing protein [Nostoc sphaeroides]MCC5632900.1 thioredoxin domain-containing protein [Nostoc sphaeroides CHAB 2801]QFS49897.1 disulfide bond formation protein DsbA [Nostoc sphaeroides CCNUC1]
MNQDSYSNQLLVLPSQRDHYQGTLNAPVVLVEYGNYECFQCGELHRLIQVIQQHFASVFPGENRICVVFRHFIENTLHPRAQKVAEAVEAAAAQGQFWPMHDLLFTHQQALDNGFLVEYADSLGLDISQFLQDISTQAHIDRINQDIESGYQSGVTDAPALFINGIHYSVGVARRRHRWTVEQIMAAIVAAIH